MSALALSLSLFAVGDAHAKPKKKKPPVTEASATKETKKDDQVAAPGDPRINTGAQGRRNATNDAAAAAEGGPNGDHLP